MMHVWRVAIFPLFFCMRASLLQRFLYAARQALCDGSLFIDESLVNSAGIKRRLITLHTSIECSLHNKIESFEWWRNDRWIRTKWAEWLPLGEIMWKFNKRNKFQFSCNISRMQSHLCVYGCYWLYLSSITANFRNDFITFAKLLSLLFIFIVGQIKPAS